MYTLIWNVGLAAITVTGVWIILFIIKWRFIRRRTDKDK